MPFLLKFPFFTTDIEKSETFLVRFSSTIYGIIIMRTFLYIVASVISLIEFY